jgi:hypothetical protein
VRGVAAAKKSILSGCCTIEASMTGIQDFDEWVVFMAGFGGNHVYIVNTKASKFKSSKVPSQEVTVPTIACSQYSLKHLL